MNGVNDVNDVNYVKTVNDVKDVKDVKDEHHSNMNGELIWETFFHSYCIVYSR